MIKGEHIIISMLRDEIIIKELELNGEIGPSIVQEPTLEDRVLELERVVGEQKELIERYRLVDLIK